MLKFGKSSKGKVVHVIGAVDSALCNKKQVGLESFEVLGLKDVTCVKCKQHKVFKDALVKEKAKKKKAKVPSTKKPVLDFIKKEKTDGSFQIIHVPSGLSFFEKIEKKVVDRALRQLNKIEIRWDVTGDKIPEGFITQCRKAVRIAYKQSGVKLPDGLIKAKDPVEPIKETKKKKGKKEKLTKKKLAKKKAQKTRTIKRRDKRSTKSIKSKKSKKSKKKIFYDFIFEQMADGIAISKLINVLVKKFGLTAKKANSKIKSNIRRMRRKSIKIMVGLTEKKENDFYKIVE